MKFRYPRLNRYRGIPPEAVEGGIIDDFRDNFRPEVVSDVISSVDVGQVGVNVAE